MPAATIALTEPMHPLCRPDCEGLCPECGEPLRAGHPGHLSDDIDPRLAGLARFLERDLETKPSEETRALAQTIRSRR